MIDIHICMCLFIYKHISFTYTYTYAYLSDFTYMSCFYRYNHTSMYILFILIYTHTHTNTYDFYAFVFPHILLQCFLRLYNKTHLPGHHCPDLECQYIHLTILQKWHRCSSSLISNSSISLFNVSRLSAAHMLSSELHTHMVTSSVSCSITPWIHNHSFFFLIWICRPLHDSAYFIFYLPRITTDSLYATQPDHKDLLVLFSKPYYSSFVLRNFCTPLGIFFHTFLRSSKLLCMLRFVSHIFSSWSKFLNCKTNMYRGWFSHAYILYFPLHTVHLFPQISPILYTE